MRVAASNRRPLRRGQLASMSPLATTRVPVLRSRPDAVAVRDSTRP